MNYVYAVWADTSVHGFLDNTIQHLNAMINSLHSHCDCTVLLQVYIPVEHKGILDGIKATISPLYYPEVDQLMQAKITHLLHQPFVDGDKVFVLDTVLLVQADIFDVFETKEFDVGLTVRNYKYHSPINAGVWCFRCNERSQRFLQFYSSEMLLATWPPYLKRNRELGEQSPEAAYVFPSQSYKCKWSDQDFLCAVHDNDMNVPFDCKIVDIGWQYNYCPSGELLGGLVTEQLYRKALSDNDIKILHFKGGVVGYKARELKVKELMIDIGKECRWI